jgi:hypothetical protein
MRSGLRTFAIAAAVIGAIASVAMLVYVGNRTESNRAQPVVMVLIAVWVLSPYVLLVAGNALSKSWSALSHTILYWTMVAVAMTSLFAYIPAGMGPVKPKPAAPFVATPPLQWILIAVALLVAARLSRRKSVAS